MIVVGGEALVDLIIGVDGAVTPVLGGGPFNTCRTIGRLGGRVSFLGRLSTDRFGRLQREGLTRDGVDMRFIIDTVDPTTLAVSEIDEHGVASYGFYIHGTAAVGLTESDLPDLSGAAALHVGTLGLALEPVAGALVRAIEAVPATTLVMVDPNCRPSVITDAEGFRARILGLMSRTDVVKASVEDLRFIFPDRSWGDGAGGLLDAGARVILVTDGARAVRAIGRGLELEVEVPQVQVVDTIGAGDAFGGGFLTRWVEHGLGREALVDPTRPDVRAALEESAAFAVRVAAITCQRAGAEPPRRAELQ